ncbi:MAG: BLUF domain-containing protein [Candidatus Thiodiazotropha sp.]
MNKKLDLLGKSDQFTQLAYISHTGKALSEKELQHIKIHYRRKQRSLNITGILIYDFSKLFHILEGTVLSIDTFIGDIRTDIHHKEINVIYTNQKCSEREFGRWFMTQESITHTQDSRVKKILNYVGSELDLI